MAQLGYDLVPQYYIDHMSVGILKLCYKGRGVEDLRHKGVEDLRHKVYTESFLSLSRAFHSFYELF